MRPHARGFTLLELLVVMTIIVVLIALLAPTLSRAKQAAQQVKVASEMHQTMLAYREYMSDNNGMVLLGFLPDNAAPTVTDDASGITVSGHATARYPWRFLPCLKDWRILFNSAPFSAATVNTYSYEMSLLPRFGLNSVFVGGDHDFNGFDANGNPNAGSGAVFRDIDVQQPGGLIVFAETACYISGSPYTFPSSTLPPDCPVADLGQYFQLQPPRAMGTRIWHVAQNQLVVDSASILGAPHSFVSSKPVVGFFDGHAEAMEMAELDDMRLWANRASSPTWNGLP